MNWRTLVLSGVTLGALAGSTSAGIIFNRGKAPTPANRPAEARPDERVGELARILRADPDERRRAAAAAELAKIDFRNNPSVGYALIEALEQDPSISVRAETAEALGRLRPLTLQVGQALESALANDQSPRVRLSARNALLPFLQSGYRLAGAKPEAYDPRSTPSVPPPPAPSMQPTQPAPAVTRRPANNPPARLAPANPTRTQTNEPPLAATRPAESNAPAAAARPTPSVPSDPRIVAPRAPRFDDEPIREIPVSRPTTPAPIGPTFGPTAPTRPATPEPARPNDEGPILNPPG